MWKPTVPAIRSFVPGAFVLAALATTAGAGLAEDRLTPQLRFVPADAAVQPPDAVTFVDLAAMRDVLEARLSLIDHSRWSADDIRLAELIRAIALPSMMAAYTRYLGEGEDMADYVGFAWSDIDTVVGFGPPPEPVVLTVGPPAPGAEAIADVLAGRGFAAEDRAGHTIWWRLADDATDLELRDPDDPLYGYIGSAARAGLVDGAFVAARNWQDVDRMLAAASGAAPSMAASADVVALAHALAQPVVADGALLQAYLMAYTLDLQSVTPFPARADPTITPEEYVLARQGRERIVAAAGTPRYGAIGFGDRQEGGTEIGVVVLSYTDRDAAETAARTVPAAVATQDSRAAGKPYSTILPYAVTADVVDVPGDRFVARIAFLDPAGALDNPVANRNQAFDALLNMLYLRDPLPLIPVE